MMAISQKIQSVMFVPREKCCRQAWAKSRPEPTPRRTAAAWNSIAITFDARITESSA